MNITDQTLLNAERAMADVINVFDSTEREGLQDTPKRYVKFLKQFLTPDPFEFTTFKNEGTDEMIVVSNIPFFSLCEHHLAPFFGHADIAYIPGERIVGLSKLPRTVDMFAQRFQNQERITSQIADFLQEKLSASGVAVRLVARHMCVEMRGVKKHDCATTTCKLLGNFKDNPMVRAEFFSHIKK